MSSGREQVERRPGDVAGGVGRRRRRRGRGRDGVAGGGGGGGRRGALPRAGRRGQDPRLGQQLDATSQAIAQR